MEPEEAGLPLLAGDRPRGSGWAGGVGATAQIVFREMARGVGPGVCPSPWASPYVTAHGCEGLKF